MLLTAAQYQIVFLHSSRTPAFRLKGISRSLDSAKLHRSYLEAFNRNIVSVLSDNLLKQVKIKAA